MRKQKQVGISSFLADRATTPTKLLSLPDKNITIIDEINPYLASEVESLDLRGNRLASLKGIEQFTCLKELDVSENRIQKCEELARLRELPHLKRLYLGNNPFLNEPIPEIILELILDKDTDIQILSFEVLSTLKDVEEREIKIIFLKNYIQKLGMHSELRSRGGVNYQKSPMEGEEILDKLVPQFYTLIEDPNLINRIKRQAIHKKKQSHESIGQALEVVKQQREQKIDELVKNIVELLHQNEQFKKSHSFMLEVNLNQNTITFSPERRRDPTENMSLGSGEFSPVKYIEMSKDDASIEDITFTNVKQPPPTAPQTQTKQFQSKYHEQTLHMSAHKQPSPPKNDLDNLQTARKLTSSSTTTLVDKIKQHTEMKQTVQSHIRKVKERELSLSKIGQSQIEQNIPPTPTSQKRSTFDMSKLKKTVTPKGSNFIKVIEENQDESQQNKSCLEQRMQQYNTKKMQHSLMNQSSIDLCENLTPQAIQTIYFRSLAKTNPMFSLLHSPSNSLNNQEKTELLQALKVDHKEKFIQLMKERISNKKLMREIEQLKADQAREIDNIVNNNRQVYDQYLVYKEQFQWIDQRQRSIQSKNEELAALLRETEVNQKKKTTALAILENNYKKLKEACAEKHQRVIFLENAEERQENIRQKRDFNIMTKYLKQLNQRAVLWSKVLALNQRSVKNRQKSLLIWGLESFAFNKLQEKAAKHQLRVHNQNILRQYITDWKIYKQLQKKEKEGIKWAFQKRSIEIMSLLRRNQANSKMRKLKDIWANRFLTEKLYKKSIQSWKLLRIQTQGKSDRAIQYLKAVTQDNIFRKLKEIVATRKGYIQNIRERREQRLIVDEFKRMIYIMRKETAQIDEKYRLCMTSKQRLQRETYLRCFITHACQRRQHRLKKEALRKKLMGKNMKSFKKVQRSIQSKMDKLSVFCHRLNFGVIVKMLRREKTSYDFSLVLAKRQKVQFLKNLRKYWQKQSSFHKSQQKMGLIISGKFLFWKLRLIKRLQVFKLKGKNYIKHRAIQQLSHQMQLNDQNTIDLIRGEKEEITRCQKQIHFLKSQLQGLSLRQLALIRQKEEMMLSISQSYEIMMELRREVDAIRGEYGDQEQKYNALVSLYNESVAALQQREHDYELLYETLKSKRLA